MFERLHFRPEKPDPRTQATWMADLGRKLFIEGNIAESKKAFANALRWAQASGDPLIEAHVYSVGAEAMHTASNDSLDRRYKAMEYLGLAIGKALAAKDSNVKKATINSLRISTKRFTAENIQRSVATEASTITKETLEHWPVRRELPGVELHLVSPDDFEASEPVTAVLDDEDAQFGWDDMPPDRWIIPLPPEISESVEHTTLVEVPLQVAPPVTSNGHVAELGTVRKRGFSEIHDHPHPEPNGSASGIAMRW